MVLSVVKIVVKIVQMIASHEKGNVWEFERLGD